MSGWLVENITVNYTAILCIEVLVMIYLLDQKDFTQYGNLSQHCGFCCMASVALVVPWHRVTMMNHAFKQKAICVRSCMMMAKRMGHLFKVCMRLIQAASSSSASSMVPLP